MSKQVSLALVLALGIAIGGGLAWWLRPNPEPAPVPVAVSTYAERMEETPDVAAWEAGLERVPPPDALPPEAESHPEYFQDLEGKQEDLPQEVPPLVEYPRAEKLTPDPLSPVAHQVLGAWDEAEDDPQPGKRRSFVLVVEPGISDSELEALARDVRSRNLEATILDVKIYDSEQAAIQPKGLDGGARAHRHLVARVSRNQAVPVDRIQVRGRPLDF
ncbi:MAG: hypothetical protein MJA83_14045 [Gammaproteobacteria bacterium]|nr:hypothetical protein [Gammaproteobacteria bacterium]